MHKYTYFYAEYAIFSDIPDILEIPDIPGVPEILGVPGKLK